METIKQFVQRVAADHDIDIKDNEAAVQFAVNLYETLYVAGLSMHEGDEEKAVAFAKQGVVVHFEDAANEEEEEEEEDDSPAKEGECVYCKEEAVYDCDRCKEADGSDGGAMCRACAREHGHEVGEVLLCGGCFEEHGHEYEEEEDEDGSAWFDRKYPNASCLRCDGKVSGNSVVYCGGGGGACETWYCADCYEDGTEDCPVCKE
jgi:hypothetical protein